MCASLNKCKALADCHEVRALVTNSFGSDKGIGPLEAPRHCEVLSRNFAIDRVAATQSQVPAPDST